MSKPLSLLSSFNMSSRIPSRNTLTSPTVLLDYNLIFATSQLVLMPRAAHESEWMLHPVVDALPLSQERHGDFWSPQRNGPPFLGVFHVSP